MKFQKTKIAIVTAGLLLAGNPAFAQYHGLNNGYQPKESRASLGITIPFGGTAEEAKPRVELSLQQLSSGNNNQSLGYRFQRDRINRDARIGFSISEQPRLMLNGRQFEVPENRLNLSDGAAVALGLGVAAIGVVIWATAETTDALTDLVDPD